MESFHGETIKPDLEGRLKRVETCQTVEGSLGICISVYQCEPYLSVFQASKTDTDAAQLLRRAQCGIERSTPKVCCPRPVAPETLPSTTPTSPPTLAPTQASEKKPPKAISDTFVDTLPEPPTCGVSNASFSKIVGGVDAKLGDFPWMALLGYKSAKTKGISWLCGGSLITLRHVLTAAHCFDVNNFVLYVVRLGELDLARKDEGAAPIDIPIKIKIQHKRFSFTTYSYDIGILVLHHDVTFSDLIRPICIPKDRELRANSFKGSNCMVAGWGRTEYNNFATHLQVVQLPVVSNEYCEQVFEYINRRVLCAGFLKGKSACNGDSGGPLILPIVNQKTLKTYFYQIGVVSFGKKCAEPEIPTVFSRVTHFVPWIERGVLGKSST